MLTWVNMVSLTCIYLSKKTIKNIAKLELPVIWEYSKCTKKLVYQLLNKIISKLSIRANNIIF